MEKLHCSPVYQVTYGNGYFSNHVAEINRLLQKNSPAIHYDGDDIEYADRLEIPRNDIVALINKITIEREKFNLWLAEKGFYYTPEQFIKILQEWVNDSDPRNEYIVLTWF